MLVLDLISQCLNTTYFSYSVTLSAYYLQITYHILVIK